MHSKILWPHAGTSVRVQFGNLHVSCMEYISAYNGPSKRYFTTTLFLVFLDETTSQLSQGTDEVSLPTRSLPITVAIRVKYRVCCPWFYSSVEAIPKKLLHVLVMQYWNKTTQVCRIQQDASWGPGEGSRETLSQPFNT